MDHGGCGLLVGAKGNEIVEIKGDPEGYLNRGYTCFKGRVSAERLTHPDRLRHPLKRTGKRGEGKWQRISWDQALGEIAENLLKIKEKHGARAVGFGAGMPKGLEHLVLIRLANIFGSPNVVGIQDVCHAGREVTGMHTCGFYPVADFHHPTKLMFFWGSNLASTNEEGNIYSQVTAQLKSGAKLIVVDPRRTEIARRADLWLQLRPGTAQALALGVIHVMCKESLYDKDFVEKYTYGFEDLEKQAEPYTPEKVEEITWVPAESIRKAARMYAGAKPAVLQWGNAIEHDVNVFDATRSLVCLMAISGNLEVPGGNVNALEPRIMSLAKFVRADLIPDKRKEMLGAHYGTIPRLMTTPPSLFRRAVLEGKPYPVRGYYGMCTNPMVAWADSRVTYETFKSFDFAAVAEIFMTPTAAMADIVLPVAHQYEMNDIGHYGIGHGLILARPKVVDPPAECWPDMKILNELGKRVSPPELWHEDHEEFLEDLVRPAGLTYREFVEKGYLKGPDSFRTYETKGFQTPTGKVELRLSTAEKFRLKPLPEFTGFPEPDNPDYPLLVTSAKSRYYLLSSYRWVGKLREKRPHPLVEVNPDTAAKYGIGEGDDVIVETKYGSITQKACVTDIVHPRVISAALGWWFPEGSPETQYDWQKSNFNMMTSMGKLGKEFGTPNITNLPCRIRKA